MSKIENSHFEKNKIYTIYVSARASESRILKERDLLNKEHIKVKVNAIPVKGESNKEIIRIFKKQLDLNVKIVKGFTSKVKRILIL